jgi:hypothetical protein
MSTPKAKSKNISADTHDESSGEYQRGMAEIRQQPGPMAEFLHPQHQGAAPEFA